MKIFLKSVVDKFFFLPIKCRKIPIKLKCRKSVEINNHFYRQFLIKYKNNLRKNKI